MSRLRKRLVSGIRSLLGYPPRSDQRLSRDSVIWCFRFFLGRDPESEEVIAGHQDLPNELALARVLMASPEFAPRRSYPELGVQRVVRGYRQAANARRLVTSELKLAVFGNCQALGFADLIEAMTGGVETIVVETTRAIMARLRSGDIDLAALIEGCDLILVQEPGPVLPIIAQRLPQFLPKVRTFPTLNFNAYHPDIVYVTNKSTSGYTQGPMGEYQSAICLWAWMNDLTGPQTVSLFRAEVYQTLGYFDYWRSATAQLRQVGEAANIPLGDLLETWRRRGCWLHSINHPQHHALADVARRVLARDGIAVIPGVESLLPDPLVLQPVWPVYPEIGEQLGLAGNYLFKPASEDGAVALLDLPDFIDASFAAFAAYRRDGLDCERLATSRYDSLRALISVGAGRTGWSIVASEPPDRAAPTRESTSTTADNPYRGLPDYQFWRRAVERVALPDFDPIVGPRFIVGKGDKVATAGSCFAQHIAATLRGSGLRFMVTERPVELSPDEARRRQYGVFSARYGNLYTARQLLQLFDRAYGRFKPVDAAWVRGDGRWVDAFRPQVEPDGFPSEAELARSRQEHLAAVRRLFKNLNVFVFTLGLTEAWRSRRDGAVYPLAPGVVAGQMDAARYEFVNFRVSEVVSDLQEFLARLRAVNPLARVILTVSPVPLIATYEDRHVLVSTTYSKSVLRTAAAEAIDNDPLSDYFPSYELITGNQTRGEYFAADLRSVTPAGVAHAMRLFLAHYTADSGAASLDLERAHENSVVSEIICDEEAIDAGSCGG